jgi:hypothetical protein
MFNEVIFDFLRDTGELSTGDCDAYFAGKTTLENVLSKENFEKLQELEDDKFTEVERIVFLQGDEANTAFKVFDEDGYLSAIHYLSGWHYPGEHETTKKLGRGTKDRVYRDGRYVLTDNVGLGYIGLEYIKKV